MTIGKPLILLLFLLSLGKGSYAQKTLQGSWTVDVEKTIDQLSMGNARYDSLPEEGKQHLKDFLEGRTFVFNGEGSVKVLFKIGEVQKEVTGTYQCNGRAENLKITAAGVTRDYALVWESPGSVKLSGISDDTGIVRTFFLIRAL